jgi:hypothetical protein
MVSSSGIKFIVDKTLSITHLLFPTVDIIIDICMTMYVTRKPVLSSLPPYHTLLQLFLMSIYTFGVLRPLRSDQIKLPLILSNTQLLFSVITATACFGLSLDHRQEFAATLMFALCMTSNANLYTWSFASVAR